MNLRRAVLVLALAVNAHTCARFGYKFYLYGDLLPDVCTLVSLLTGLIFLDIYRLRPTSSHSVYTLLVQYLTQKLFLTIGNLLNCKLKKLCSNVERMQEDVLRSILNQNRDTMCAKAFGLSEVQTVQDFITKAPLTRYKDYENFASIVENSGSADIFFPGKTDYIAMTSGTTSGKNKKFPKSMKILKRTMGKWICLAQKMFLNIPNNNYLRKWLMVRTKPNIIYSKSGIRCGPISGLASDMSINFYVTPKELMVHQKEEVVLYINIIFGLLEPEICNLFFTTSQVALLFFRVMERNWEQLCDDIELGIVSQNVDLPGEVRATLEKHLRGGNRERANFLRGEFSQGFNDIVSRIWPTCPGLFAMATGAFVTQANILKELYLGDVPIFSPFHAGTETVYGINIDLEEPEVTYLAMAPYIFLEFVPVEHIESDFPRTLLAHEVSVGEMYELVVTTFEGLYRYRTEDVVQITGFHGTIPKYRFVRRAGDILSVCTDHVPEYLVSEAMRTTAFRCGTTLAECTTTENIHVERVTGAITGEQRYVVFAEFHWSCRSWTDNERLMVDAELCRLHEMYAKFRASGRVLPVRIVEVESGTFEDFRSLYLGLNPNTSGMQYKLPRIVRRDEYLSYLLRRQKKE